MRAILRSSSILLAAGLQLISPTHVRFKFISTLFQHQQANGSQGQAIERRGDEVAVELISIGLNGKEGGGKGFDAYGQYNGMQGYNGRPNAQIITVTVAG